MPYETLDSIINQANNLGTYFFLYSGGEPLVRGKDLIRLCEAHLDCQFTAFTNGTLIDEEFADKMLRIKNFIPAISVEGFEEATDFRRGIGTFAKVEKVIVGYAAIPAIYVIQKRGSPLITIICVHALSWTIREPCLMQ